MTPPKNSVFIATKKYHIDLCHMLHPEIDCIYLPSFFNLNSFHNTYQEIFNQKTFYNVLPFKHFVNLEKQLQAGEDVHYCKEICKTMGVEYTTKTRLPIISEEIKNSVIEKAKKISLNLNNFVFITPESQSNKEPYDGFWRNIVEHFYKNGVDVFFNVMQLNPKYGTAKTCFLTFEEGYYLASLSKGIVGLRSGFIEPLTSIKDLPIICYYTDLKDRGMLKALPAEIVLKGFSLKKLPNVNKNNIFEYNIHEINEDKVIEKILKYME